MAREVAPLRTARARWQAQIGNGRWLRVLLQRTFPLWERLGVHVTPAHYAQPIPVCRELGDRPWTRPSEMVGIASDVDAQLAWLEGAVARFGGELPPGGPMFNAADAAVLHLILRDARPRRVIEIGGGESTRVTARALALNTRDGAPEAELTTVEPHPDPLLRRGLPGVTRLIEARAQDVPLDAFTALAAGDVLFIDSSHVLAIGSDVQYELLEIVPRLAPGVLVHVHDVFLPDEYPRPWVMRNRWFWNEQYLLQAFLCFNDAFEIVWAGAHAARADGDRVRAALPGFARDTRRPGSFWMRRVR